MLFQSYADLPVTGASAAGRAACHHYCVQLLSYGPDLRALFDAADKEPGCAYLQANAACLHLAFEGREGWQNAAPYLTRMRAAMTPDLTERELLYCKAVEAWAAKDFHGALNLLERIALDHPADLVALKWGQYHAFNLGDQADLLRLGQIAVEAHGDQPYIHGLLAFALEQNHMLEAAERAAQRAVEIAIDDAWAHHAFAHVMETEGRAAEGITWLSHCDHIWATKGTFIREHNWWHAALFRLAVRDIDGALKVFDDHLWGEWPEFPQEQIGAASLLWRLELAGVSAGERWQPVVAKARERRDDHILPFHDLHYLFALTAAGSDEEANGMVTDIMATAELTTGPAALAWREGAVPAAKGILCYGRGDWSGAIRELEAALPQLGCIGGSHAQRDVFVRTLNAARARQAGRAVQL